jgi:hypothetical protein
MTPWSWFYGEADVVDSEGQYDLGDFETKEAAIAAANRDLPPATPFYVIEARSSTDVRFEGADFVPFLRTRNKKRLTTGLRVVA